MTMRSAKGERMDAEDNCDIYRHGDCDQCYLRDAEFTFNNEWWCEICLLSGVLYDEIFAQIEEKLGFEAALDSLTKVTLDGHDLDQIIFFDGKDEIHVIDQSPLIAELSRLEREVRLSTH